jgi:hypothetical protein
MYTLANHGKWMPLGFCEIIVCTNFVIDHTFPMKLLYNALLINNKKTKPIHIKPYNDLFQLYTFQ